MGICIISDHIIMLRQNFTIILSILIRPFQINFLFPVLDSSIFACGRAVHFHYFIIRLAAFQAIICLT